MDEDDGFREGLNPSYGLVFRRKRLVPGVVLMRTDFDNPERKKLRLEAAIARYGAGLFGRYTVVEEGRFRSRRLWSAS